MKNERRASSQGLGGGTGAGDPLPDGCGYQGYEFGAGFYPDSICVGGMLYDADHCDDEGRLYSPLEQIPCPICHRAEAVTFWTERNRLNGTTQLAALKAARSLVRNIRQNRGLSR